MCIYIYMYVFYFKGDFHLNTIECSHQEAIMLLVCQIRLIAV